MILPLNYKHFYISHYGHETSLIRGRTIIKFRHLNSCSCSSHNRIILKVQDNSVSLDAATLPTRVNNHFISPDYMLQLVDGDSLQVSVGPLINHLKKKLENQNDNFYNEFYY